MNVLKRSACTYLPRVQRYVGPMPVIVWLLYAITMRSIFVLYSYQSSICDWKNIRSNRYIVYYTIYIILISTYIGRVGRRFYVGCMVCKGYVASGSSTYIFGWGT